MFDLALTVEFLCVCCCSIQTSYFPSIADILRERQSIKMHGGAQVGCEPLLLQVEPPRESMFVSPLGKQCTQLIAT